ncbi:MAG: CPBP family intramembrane metalloprotease [Treponema sp.]|nr:CPBP family intramembrane metalloprotease [Treponema sp.]
MAYRIPTAAHALPFVGKRRLSLAMRRALLVPLIMYVVLFLPGALTAPGDGAMGLAFSLGQCLTRLFTYTLPALALVSFHIIGAAEGRPLLRFRWSDVPVSLLCVAALVGVGGLLAALAEGGAGYAPPPTEAPLDAASRVALAVFCGGTGYLEEGFFRVYLPLRLEAAGVGKTTTMLVAAALFAVCHRYEGAWGVLNAGLAALLLALALRKTRSFHGIALAHGIYNALIMML